MTKTNTNSKKGFTIIEVVLVLAIAGLIFLMVFIAFPALQRSQRDTQRTDDMARVQSQLMSWQNNHSNKLPGPADGDEYIDYPEGGVAITETFDKTTCNNNKACQFLRDYMNAASTETNTATMTDSGVTNTFQDPSGELYNIVITKNISGNAAPLGSVSHTNGVTDGVMAISNTVANDGKSTAYTLEGDFVAYTMFIIPGATCEEDHAIQSTKNNFAILYRLEGSGIKCTNNGS